MPNNNDLLPFQRLDQLLVDKGFYKTRARARDAILRGSVFVDGSPAKKASQKAPADAAISIDDPAIKYVSRAALKLVHALDQYRLDTEARVCIDVGASTGGFTQVLLERGAAKVYAVDVGHGQLQPEISRNARVIVMENANARDLTRTDFDEMFDFIVCDVSFISLQVALPAILDMAPSGSALICLIKPQFEAGRDAIGKGGIVSDPAVHEAVIARISHWLGNEMGWTVGDVVASPVTGGDGNREFLISAVKP